MLPGVLFCVRPEDPLADFSLNQSLRRTKHGNQDTGKLLALAHTERKIAKQALSTRTSKPSQFSLMIFILQSFSTKERFWKNSLEPMAKSVLSIIMLIFQWLWQ